MQIRRNYWSIYSVMMLGQKLLSFPLLSEGILIKRYKRFLADVELANGQVVTAHCANTGPMKGVLFPGRKVRLRYTPSPTRKLKWSWEQAEVPSFDGSTCWVGVNTSLPNKIIKLALEAFCLKDQLGPIGEIRSEVVYGRDNRSRIDLLITPDEKAVDRRKIYLEIKNTTWADGDVALFPDTVTTRGQKHLKELIGVLGPSRGVLVPCLSRPDVKSFAPGDSADPVYGELFRMALNAGVEVFPCCFGFYRDSVTWEGIRPLNV